MEKYMIDLSNMGKLPSNVRWIGGKVARRTDLATNAEKSADMHLIEVFDLSEWDTVVASGTGNKVLSNHFLTTRLQSEKMYGYESYLTNAKAKLDLVYDYVPDPYVFDGDSYLQIGGLISSIAPVQLEADWFDRDNKELSDGSYELLAVPLLVVALPRPVRSLSALNTLTYAYGAPFTYTYFGTNMDINNPELRMMKSTMLGLGVYDSPNSQDGICNFNPHSDTEAYQFYDNIKPITKTDTFNTLVVCPWTVQPVEGQLISKIELQGVFGSPFDTSVGISEVLESFNTLITKVEEGNVILGEILKK